MYKNLALLSMLFVLAGCNGFSGFDDDGRDSDKELPPQNLSGHIQKGIMQNAAVRVLGVNTQGRLDTDEQGVVSGPISFTGDDGGYFSAI
jgi:hypothetical protein